MAFMRIPSFINKAKDGLTKKKIREELLSYKKLLDEEILTQEEFDLKADELKKILLTKEAETKSVQPKSEEVSNIENKDISEVHPIHVGSDENYEKALTEIEENKLHKPSWARALSGTKGDKAKAESLYIEIRVANFEEKKLDEERRARELLRQELFRIERQNKLNKLNELYEKLNSKMATLVRPHLSQLVANNFDGYLDDIDIMSRFERTNLVKFLMNKSNKYIVYNLEKGPDGKDKGNYGVLLIVALQRGLDVQCAKNGDVLRDKWGRSKIKLQSVLPSTILLVNSCRTKA